MKFVLLVEGHTEHKALPSFLKRWLDPRLPRSVGIKTVRFDGWRELVEDVAKKAHLHLNGPDRAEIVAVISLLDLYGPTFYPADHKTVGERVDWGKKHIQAAVGHPKFRHFFAVHECEAWLLSDPAIFPTAVERRLRRNAGVPENVDFDEPPARLLNNLYKSATNKTYKKAVDGQRLFGRLDPNMAYE